VAGTLYHHTEARCPTISIRPTGRAWELLYLLTRRDLKLRYQDTALGFLWSLIKPLALGGVLYVALSKFARIDVPNYHLVLLSGLFPWVWFSSSVLLATPSFAGNAALLKKVQFPRLVLPFSTVLNNGVHFFISIPVLIVLLAADGRYPNWTWLIGIPVFAALELALLMGVIMLLASIDVYFRDLEHLTEVFLQLLFYLTPILYPLDLIPEKYRPLVQLNPMTSIIDGWRQLFMENHLALLEIWPALLFTAAALAIGGGVFRRLEPGFADAL
jgi:ABC-type polysaccharide/polyol phosphate export permease